MNTKRKKDRLRSIFDIVNANPSAFTSSATIPIEFDGGTFWFVMHQNSSYLRIESNDGMLLGVKYKKPNYFYSAHYSVTGRHYANEIPNQMVDAVFSKACDEYGYDNLIHLLDAVKKAAQDLNWNSLTEAEQLKEITTWYGYDIPEAEIINYEILERNDRDAKLKIKHKITGEIFISDMRPDLPDPLADVQLVVFSRGTEGIWQQCWYQSGTHHRLGLKQLGQRALAAQSEKSNLYCVRNFVNVTTKYGNFCLRLEKNNNGDGPSAFIAIYYGDADEIMQFNSGGFLTVTDPGILPIDNFEYYEAHLRSLDLSPLVEVLIEEYGSNNDLRPEENPKTSDQLEKNKPVALVLEKPSA